MHLCEMNYGKIEIAALPEKKEEEEEETHTIRTQR